jgi:hypothetical protein
MTRSQRAPSAFLAVPAGRQLVLSKPGDYVSLDAARLPNAEASEASPSRGDPTDEPKQAWGAACRGQRDAIRWLGLWRFGLDLDRVVVAAGSREKLPVARDPFELVLATRPELET